MGGWLVGLPLTSGPVALFLALEHGAAIDLLRGVVLGSFSFAAFFLVLALLIEPTGLLIGFGCSILVAQAIQGFAPRALDH